MARATNDLNAVRMLLGPAIMYSANTIVYTAGALAFMISISPWLTLYTFLPLPAVSIVIQTFGRRIHERFERIQAMFSDISARAQENFSGARLIRAYVQEEAEIRAFESRKSGIHPPQPETGSSDGHALAHARTHARLRSRARALARRSRSHPRTLHVTLHHESGNFHPYLLPRSQPRCQLSGSMSVGQFVSFSTYMMQLTWPIIALGWVINIFQRGTASLIRINEIMHEQPEIKDAPGAQDREMRRRDRIPRPQLRYDGKQIHDKHVLHDLNLRVPAGSSLAIVGPTGSGKTTLVEPDPAHL